MDECKPLHAGRALAQSTAVHSSEPSSASFAAAAAAASCSPLATMGVPPLMPPSGLGVGAAARRGLTQQTDAMAMALARQQLGRGRWDPMGGVRRGTGTGAGSRGACIPSLAPPPRHPVAPVARRVYTSAGDQGAWTASATLGSLFKLVPKEVWLALGAMGLYYAFTWWDLDRVGRHRLTR